MKILYPTYAGLVPARGANGRTAMIGEAIPRSLPSGYANTILKGDPCSMNPNGDGTVVWGDGTNAGGICKSLDFVFDGAEGVFLADNRVHLFQNWIGGTQLGGSGFAKAMLHAQTDKSVLFHVVADGVVTKGMRGRLANLNLVAPAANAGVGAPDGVSAISSCTLNVASVALTGAQTATAVIIEDIEQSVASGYTSLTSVDAPPYTVCLVRINKAF